MRTLRNKFVNIRQQYQKMCKWINQLIQFKYNNTCHKAIDMKPFHVKSSAYIKSNDKDCKFAAGDHVRISKHKIIFAKGYTPYQSEEVFLLRK